MKVRELIALLNEADPDREVVMSKDTEGNAFSMFEAPISVGVYVPDSAWSGEFYQEPAEDDDEEDVEIYEEMQEADQAVTAVCLYPTN